MSRPRLAQIAERAGVSQATVSRVLNNKPQVSDLARQQVLTALDILGYERPEAYRRYRSGLVGLVTPELTNPIFPALAQRIGNGLAAAGYTAVLCTQTAGGIPEAEYVQLLIDRGVSGIIFVSGLHADTTVEPERYLELVELGLPLVMVNGALPGLEGVPFISDDDRNGMEQAVAHLAGLGHSRIGLALGPTRFVPVVRKLEGFQAAMRSRGLASDLVVHSEFSVTGGTVAATRLLGRGATAIICGSDLMALGAIACAQSAGLSVPDDLSVIGQDDSALIEFTNPPLTTLRQNVLAIGEAAVQAFLSQVNQPGGLASHEVLFKPKLVVRGTTAAAPATNQ